MRAFLVVNCQSALVWLALRSCSQAAISSMRICLLGMRRSRHWDVRCAVPECRGISHADATFWGGPMGQILHGSAKTTHAVRAAIQRSKASIQELASRYDLNPKTVMKWRKRAFLYDAPMGPKVPRSTVLSAEEEALAVAFRKHTLLPLDDCLYALQATIPHLTRSSLHRLFQRHEISRLPAIEGETGRKKAFKRYPIGYFHIDIAEVRTEEGKLHLFVAIDRTSKLRATPGEG